MVNRPLGLLPQMRLFRTLHATFALNVCPFFKKVNSLLALISVALVVYGQDKTLRQVVVALADGRHAHLLQPSVHGS